VILRGGLAGNAGNGLLATSSDGKGNTTRLFYDGFDRLQRVQHADGLSDLYRTDGNGNVTRRITRAGDRLEANFDALNRLMSREVPETAHAAAVDYSYGYDLEGRLLRVAQSLDPGPIVYRYDTAGRLISEQHPDGKLIGLAVDADGNRTGMTWPESGAQAYQVTYAYDELGRMRRVFEGEVSGERLASFAYDLLSQRVSASYANDVTSAWRWRRNGTLASVAHGFGGGAAVTFEYLYNSENAVRARLVSDAAYLAGPGNPALALGTRAYAAANALNQYPSVAGVALGYDANGNLTGDGVWSYGYDAENRLVSATRSGVTIGYGYDAAGRRRSRTVNGTVTSFLSAGDQEIAEYDQAGALVRRFVWGAGLDDLVATINAAGGVAVRRRGEFPKDAAA
jgi:YD repeat-containing protein